MATAKRVPERPVEDTRDVQLTLTHEEATVLKRLVGYHVVGSHDGPRVHTSKIYHALSNAGIVATGRFNVDGDHLLVLLPDNKAGF